MRRLRRSMPSPVEALPCGSRSTTRTRSPIAASAVPRLIAVVVLPTPPFWLAMASTRGGLAGSVLEASDTTSAAGGEVGGASVMSDMARNPGSWVRSPPRAAAPFHIAERDDAALRVGLTRDQLGLELPIFSGLGQFS